MRDFEKEHGRAVARREPTTQRLPPRMGGAVPLPSAAGSADLFLVHQDDLTVAERAAAGWCVRLGVPEPIGVRPHPGDAGYDMERLLVELNLTSGGTTYSLEVNAYPGCLVHLVGEQLSGRVRWESSSVAVPEPGAATLRWQLSRGLVPTTATRGFTVQSPAEGIVPPFATGFALFSGDNEVAEPIELDFVANAEALRIQAHYTTDDLLQCVGAFTALPPGAGYWRWIEATAEPVRLVFCFGEVRP